MIGLWVIDADLTTRGECTEEGVGWFKPPTFLKGHLWDSCKKGENKGEGESGVCVWIEVVIVVLVSVRVRANVGARVEITVALG